MPTRKDKPRKGIAERKRKIGSEATPALIATLSEDGNLETVVGLAIRIGNEPFGSLSDDAAGIAEGIAILHKFWPLHARAATQYQVKRFGPGTRPALWWIHSSPAPRPFVRPRDWTLNGDCGRFRNERAATDLKFFQEHKLLLREELRKLAEAMQPKGFGPEETEK